MGAEQEALLPPLLPLQDQFHGPLPLTVLAVPAVQRSELGAALTATPLALPQKPLTGEDEDNVTVTVLEGWLRLPLVSFAITKKLWLPGVSPLFVKERFTAKVQSEDPQPSV